VDGPDGVLSVSSLTLAVMDGIVWTWTGFQEEQNIYTNNLMKGTNYRTYSAEEMYTDWHQSSLCVASLNSLFYNFLTAVVATLILVLAYTKNFSAVRG
jgi:hypothetical protein